MNKMTGIAIMALGALLFIAGVFVFKSGQKPNSQANATKQMKNLVDMAIADGVLTQREEQKIIDLAQENNTDATAVIQEAKSRIEQSEEDSETEIIDHIKKKGDDFEKYVVQKFSSKYFNVKEWAGDKFVNGIYADTSLQPDLMMEFKLRNETELFSVECKWRNEFKNGSVQFASKDQFKRYQQFEKERKTPVFIALGIGGKAGNPEFLFTLPLRSISSNSMTKEELDRYGKDKSKNFFYDAKENLLK
jgi:hypothetical protein